jgi:hypothetical protein
MDSTHLILRLDVCTLLHQQPRQLWVFPLKCPMESRCPTLLPDATTPPAGRKAAGQLQTPYPTCRVHTNTHLITSMDICSLLQQQPQHLYMSLLRCEMESRAPSLLQDATTHPAGRKAAGQLQTPQFTCTARTALTRFVAWMFAPFINSSFITSRFPLLDAQ